MTKPVLLGLKVFEFDNSNMFSCSRNAQVTFVEKPEMKIYVHYSELQTLISDKVFKSTVLNKAFSSLNAGSFIL